MISILLTLLTLYPDICMIFNVYNVYFDNSVSHIYPSELQLNQANTSDIKALFLGLHLPISNDIVSTKIYDKRDDLILKLSIFHF